ncbi:MAG: hypothetical protein V3V35_04635 [Dehalococcoidia bacterium]
MPRFEIITASEAKLKSASAKTAEVVQEYLVYIGRLGAGQAGRLLPSTGETVRAVRRRLGTAARMAGKDLVIKRAGDEIYFWVKERKRGTGRRGRPRKNP